MHWRLRLFVDQILARGLRWSSKRHKSLWNIKWGCLRRLYGGTDSIWLHIFCRLRQHCLIVKVNLGVWVMYRGNRLVFDHWYLLLNGIFRTRFYVVFGRCLDCLSFGKFWISTRRYLRKENIFVFICAYQFLSTIAKGFASFQVLHKLFLLLIYFHLCFTLWISCVNHIVLKVFILVNIFLIRLWLVLIWYVALHCLYLLHKFIQL